MFLFITILAITAVTCQSPKVEIEAQVPSGGQTAISNLHTDLLAGVPGYFWGNLTTSDVENSCRYLAVDGLSGVNASVVAGNQSFMEDLTVTAMEYCDVSNINRSPSGVQALFQNQKGRSIAVLCGPELDLMPGSCTAYLLGPDISAKYDQLNSSTPGACPGCVDDCRCVDVNKDWSCFPGDAQVTLESGKQLPMSKLRAGDKVQSVAEEGNLIYDEVYFFGHQDSSAMGTFVALKVHLPERPAATIYLSPRHFIPVGPSLKASRPTYAKDVGIGDAVFLVNGNGAAAGAVTAKYLVPAKGLYNPYTKGGDIVVNGVLASAHSSWQLDDIIPASMTHHLPAVYNILFRPLFWMHKLGAPGLVESVVSIFEYKSSVI